MQYSFIVPAKWKDECTSRDCRGVRGGSLEGVEAWKCAAHFALSRTKAAIEAPTIGGTDSQDTLNYSCSWRRRCKVLLLLLPSHPTASLSLMSLARFSIFQTAELIKCPLKWAEIERWTKKFGLDLQTLEVGEGGGGSMGESVDCSRVL